MKIAIVGSGVSGLAATWLLNEYSDHEAHLYESDTRPGGHANTVRFTPPGRHEGEDSGVDVDTGFIVLNPPTYPNFLRFLRLHSSAKQGSWLNSILQRSAPFEDNPMATGINVVPTEMTFSVTRDGGKFEWAGKNLFTVFCQPRRLLDPGMWRMVYDVLRFNVCSRAILRKKVDSADKVLSIGEYLELEGYSREFTHNYLVPMTAAIWSTPPGKCALDFPARTLIQFMFNHHLLQVTGKPAWLTIQGGSHRYVNQILSNLPENQLHLSTPVVKVVTHQQDESTKVVLTTEHGEEEYDHVILACHSDTALEILEAGNSTGEERRILGEFKWNQNEVILHSDVRMMPTNRSAWSCWNYLTTTTGPEADITDRVSLTYGMNDLQHIPESKYGPVLATLNAPFEPAQDKVVGRWKYDHPVLDHKAVEAQNEMHKIQNQRSITFAGAYLKYGFHEDGFTSGLLAACAVDEEPGRFPTFRYSKASHDLSIPILGATVKPPFDIQYADHHLAIEREGWWTLDKSLAILFRFFEVWGLRALIGSVGSFILYCISLMLGVTVDRSV
ncbi:amine oxidase [Coprinopsis marcescibilis]|uniref:Amine oxidase n=1 Tax=Coprinopsis marcescibilis TaxID=230819 RepID=A0A5C3L473_COPMA|nr:amine oxidase [Coprinopsis marcescibilis]